MKLSSEGDASWGSGIALLGCGVPFPLVPFKLSTYAWTNRINFSIEWTYFEWAASAVPMHFLLPTMPSLLSSYLLVRLGYGMHGMRETLDIFLFGRSVPPAGKQTTHMQAKFGSKFLLCKIHPIMGWVGGLLI